MWLRTRADARDVHQIRRKGLGSACRKEEDLRRLPIYQCLREPLPVFGSNLEMARFASRRAVQVSLPTSDADVRAMQDQLLWWQSG